MSGLVRHARARSDHAHDRIREAARVLFVEKGYSALTLDELASHAGVTRQTLYRHYAGKYEIALEYLAGSRAETLAAWLCLDQGDLADRSSVLTWVRSVIAQAATRRDFRVCVEITSTEPAYRSVLARQIAEIVEGLAGVHDFFARAASDPQGLDAAKAHLFIATMMERSDFIAVGEEWFARDHLEQIMTDWLIALTR